jgi:hypothetical protein
MADLNDLQAAGSTKIVGSDATGVESNYQKVDSSGSAHVAVVGDDGLYKAKVDEHGRVAVDVIFLGSIYKSFNLQLDGTGTEDMNVNGATTPQSFRFTPVTGEVYYVESISIIIEDNANASLTEFGALAALTNGIDFNVKSKGSAPELMVNLKTNAGILTKFSQDPFVERRSSGLTSVTTIKGTIDLKNRIVLDGDQGDYIEAVVRDNITGLTTAKVSVEVWKIKE